MAWWVTVLIYVVGTLLYEVLRPKPKFDAPTCPLRSETSSSRRSARAGRSRSSGARARSRAPWSPANGVARLIGSR